MVEGTVKNVSKPVSFVVITLQEATVVKSYRQVEILTAINHYHINYEILYNHNKQTHRKLED